MSALWRMMGVGILFSCFTGALQAAPATISVDYTKPKQTIAGFGASITWVALDLKNFSAHDQTASAGLSMVRAGSMLCEFNPSPGAYESRLTVSSPWSAKLHAIKLNETLIGSTSFEFTSVRMKTRVFSLPSCNRPNTCSI